MLESTEAASPPRGRGGPCSRKSPEGMPPSAGTVPVGDRGSAWFAALGCAVWTDPDTGAAYADVRTAFPARPGGWVDAATVVELAMAAAGAPVPVAFGRRNVEVRVEDPDLFAPVVVVRHGRAEARARGMGAAVALVELARRGLLADAERYGLTRAGALADDRGATLFLLSGVSLSDVRKAAQRHTDRVAQETRRAATPDPEAGASVVRPAPPFPFALLPGEVVQAVGYAARRGPTSGQPKYDVAALAVHAWLAGRHEGQARTVELGRDDVDLDGHEHLVTVERVAQYVHERVLLRRVLTPVSQDDAEFRRTYDRVLRSHGALLKLRVGGAAVLSDLGGAVDGTLRKGRRWSLAGGPLDTTETVPAPPRPFVLARPPEPPHAPTADAVDAAGHLAALVATEPEFAEAFAWGRTRTALEGQRGRKTKVVRWVRRHAWRDPDGHRHHTVGLFRKEELDVRGAACLVPWITADVDRRTVEEADAAARRIVREVGRLGGDLDAVTALYTGGRGFHVRIPAGMLGAPVFGDERDVQRVLGVFFDLLTDEPVDAGVLSPRRCVRAVGSRHEQTGLVAVGLTGTEFLAQDLDLLDTRAQRHYPHVLPDPLAVPPAPGLVALLEEAGRRVSGRAAGTPSEGMIAALLGGVGEGDPWFGDLVGRNEAAFRYAVFLHDGRHRSAEEAWDTLVNWNRSNTPPLPRMELATAFTSAARYVGRDGEARAVVRGGDRTVRGLRGRHGPDRDRGGRSAMARARV